MPGVVLETEGSVRLRCKRALFTMKTSKKNMFDLNNPYFHLTMLLIEQFFQKANCKGQHPKAVRRFDIELPLHASVESKFKFELGSSI